MNTRQVNRVKMVKGVKIHPAKGILFFSSSVTSFFTDALMIQNVLTMSELGNSVDHNQHWEPI